MKTIVETERVSMNLCSLYQRYGYSRYKMGKFEEYDLYVRNRDFLTAAGGGNPGVISFTDVNGKLMALKPDVTLSIVRHIRDTEGTVQRFFYNENVYRVSKKAGAFREIPQVGLECIGAVDDGCVREVLSLAAESLRIIAGDSGVWALNVSHEETPASAERMRRIIGALDAETRDHVHIDFSTVGDLSYYNGLMFRGFVEGIPEAVLSGGQYDRLMRRMGHKEGTHALGFAVYLDRLEKNVEEGAEERPGGVLDIALPKGRLGERVYRLFEAAGFACPGALDGGRKLVFENREKGLRCFWVKPSDVPVYVERGVADVGVAGRDVLLEREPDVCELLDLRTGLCRMAVAAREDFQDDPGRTLRVATEFPHIAQSHYTGRGRDIDIIPLRGSVELAPLLGLSDVIVDIVETGTTLRENHLQIVETIVELSARLIANKASFTFKGDRVLGLVRGLETVIKENGR
ncbi:MAG: ATP phosphoribosyltransferase [Synergistaceae bacterium]|nr:ATP phosphoribosyltransferase [Synergistaceae bacterium]